MAAAAKKKAKVPRVKLLVGVPEEKAPSINLAKVKCISSGCGLLDCVLGGGWGRGRIANIVGDKAVGKSLLAIEACANFHAALPKGKIYYRESEAAFDIPYAETLGLPPDIVNFGEDGIDSAWDTVEDIFEDLDAVLDEHETSGLPGLYIIDSLDALSSRAEMEREIDKGSFGLEKQKMMGLLFRKLVRRIKRLDFLVIVVSQIRDKIGVVFGDKHTRTGGKALDFYASQILWLSHLGIINSTVKGQKRATGVKIKAKCKKNKIGKPFRECEMEIDFGFGIDDIGAGLDWLESVKAFERLGVDSAKAFDDLYKAAERANGDTLKEIRLKVMDAVIAEWEAIEATFVPHRRKYD